MVAGHMTKKNGYWYLILMVQDEAGRSKQKWISTHLRVEGNKKKAEEMLLAARREYTDLTEMQSRQRAGGAAPTRLLQRFPVHIRRHGVVPFFFSLLSSLA